MLGIASEIFLSLKITILITPTRTSIMPIACITLNALPKKAKLSNVVIGLPKSNIDAAVVAFISFNPEYHVITYNSKNGAEISIQLNCADVKLGIIASLLVNAM